MCWKLSQEVQRLFPDATYTIIGGFIFLRFICPAIIAPDGYGILNGDFPTSKFLSPHSVILFATEVPDASRRGLILISKVLQNLSNGVEFGQKEEYMLPLNPFITENIPMMHRFFDRLAVRLYFLLLQRLFTHSVCNVLARLAKNNSANQLIRVCATFKSNSMKLKLGKYIVMCSTTRIIWMKSS